MAELETKSPVAKAIEDHYVALQVPEDWPYMRCSKIGSECSREIWYDLHWVSPLKKHEGRMQRLFNTGHLGEDRMIQDLQRIGCDVLARDPETEKQWTVSFLHGHFRGSCDGVGSRIPGLDPDETVLLEFKTMNKKKFDEWRKHGVQWANPTYYGQVQIYMRGMKLDKALFMATCKDDDRVETEVVEHDRDASEALLNKAALILNAETPPEKAESFACRWCRHKPVCLDGAWPRANCRTCIDFRFKNDGGWFCDLHQHDLSLERQKRGCSRHISIPDLVPGGQIVTADDVARTVTYQFADGTTFVDGRDLKTAAPEVE